MGATVDQESLSGAVTPLQSDADSNAIDQGGSVAKKSSPGVVTVVPRSDNGGHGYTWRFSGPAKALISIVALAVACGGGYLAWQYETATDVPVGFAKSNGRLETERIDVATKYAGRLADVRVAEGDWVTAGQVVAVMDTATLEAQLREAEAAMRQAEHQLEQADALVAQRESDLAYAQQQLNRATQLESKGFAPQEQLQQRRSIKLVAEAALRSANAQVLHARAAIDASRARAETQGTDRRQHTGGATQW